MTDSTIAPVGSLLEIVIDCPDPMALAGFYAAITGWTVKEGSDPEWTTLDGGAAVPVAFQRIDDYETPTWPGGAHPQQFHLDVEVPDLDAAEHQVLALGARKAEHQPGTTFRVFLDPAGHPFCLCAS